MYFILYYNKNNINHVSMIGRFLGYFFFISNGRGGQLLTKRNRSNGYGWLECFGLWPDVSN